MPSPPPLIQVGVVASLFYLKHKVEIIRTPEYFEVICILIKLSSISTNFINITSTRFISTCSTCLLQDLLTLTSKQYFLLMVYQITIMSLLICHYKSGQNLEKTYYISTDK